MSFSLMMGELEEIKVVAKELVMEGEQGGGAGQGRRGKMQGGKVRRV